MKTKFTFLVALLLTSFHSFGQLIPCRPGMCMIDYNYHDDRVANADKTTIQTIKPDILIDNTPGGFWHGGCIAGEYTPLGIEVYSYIHGSWEAFDLSDNLDFIDAIAIDSATGVFFDEVSSFPDSASKAYLTQIHNRCIAKGLKLIFNPGVSTFDPWLMSHCDYLMSDEHYTGTRALTTSEAPFRSRILVVNEGVPDADSAAVVSLGARANGFGYSYACEEYIHLPTWLAAYDSSITRTPDTPVITQIGSVLYSNAPYGNQWYNTSGAISLATNSSYTPTGPGAYYSIVTLDSCTSARSNTITIATTGMSTVNSQETAVYPNPANSSINVVLGKEPAVISIYSIDGRLQMGGMDCTTGMTIDVSALASGIYIAYIKSVESTTAIKLAISR